MKGEKKMGKVMVVNRMMVFTAESGTLEVQPEMAEEKVVLTKSGSKIRLVLTPEEANAVADALNSASLDVVGRMVVSDKKKAKEGGEAPT